MQLYRSELSQPFIDLFLKTIQLSEEEFELVLACFRREYIPRKFYLLKAGQICKQTSYINKGSTRTYTMDEKGGEHILYFSFEDWWVGDLESYHTQQVSKCYVQAVEDCELLCILKTGMDKLEAQLPKLKEWHTMKQFKAHFANLNRLSEIKTLSPEERYLQLLNKHPQIFQRIPLNYISSYLDIEPPSLSRLRKRLSSK